MSRWTLVHKFRPQHDVRKLLVTSVNEVIFVSFVPKLLSLPETLDRHLTLQVRKTFNFLHSVHLGAERDQLLEPSKHIAHSISWYIKAGQYMLDYRGYIYQQKSGKQLGVVAFSLKSLLMRTRQLTTKLNPF